MASGLNRHYTRLINNPLTASQTYFQFDRTSINTMSELPEDLKYTRTHEWARQEDDGALTVGITDHAQGLLGDLVFVEPPDVGREYAADEACAVVESVKAASDVHIPVAGEIIEINQGLADAPESINEDPYGAGWLFKLRPVGAGATDSLLNADDYSALIEAG